jgi:hypothetical protein
MAHPACSRDLFGGPLTRLEKNKVEEFDRRLARAPVGNEQDVNAAFLRAMRELNLGQR